MHRVTANAVADRAAETAAGAYACLVHPRDATRLVGVLVELLEEGAELVEAFAT